MILPFTTNQWNVIRFVALTLVCVPILECAFRKAHRLQAARRILNGKPARIRASRLVNWGLHQEVDEFNYSSKIMLIIVMIFYVGLMLCIELASGSVQAETKGTWIAPASKIAIQEPPVVYDTSFVAAGTHKGCMSKASRMEMQELSGHIARRKIQNSYFRTGKEKKLNRTLRAHIWDKSLNKIVQIMDNRTHLRFVMMPGPNGVLPYATIDDEKVCLPDGIHRVVCFSKSENISVLGLVGNLLHFDDGLVHMSVVKGTKFLLSNDAFAVEGGLNEDKLARASLANSRTRQEFLENKNRTGLVGFHFKFKYADIAAGAICSQKPELKPQILMISQNAKLLVPDKPLETSILLKTTATCIGLLPDTLSIFWETRNSSMVCYHAPHNYRFIADMFCAKKNPGGAISLSKTVQAPKLLPNFTGKTRFPEPYIVHNGRSQLASMYIVWTISWKSPDLELADIARHAFLSFVMLRNLFAFHNEYRISEIFAARKADAKNVAEQFKKGIPKLRQVGVSKAVYKIIRKEERATVITWVFLLWVAVSFLAACFLLFIKLKRPFLIPDLDLLYRHSVMQQYEDRSSNVINNPPTVCISNIGELGRLHVSYGNIGARKTQSGDNVL